MEFINTLLWFVIFHIIEMCNSDCLSIRTDGGNNTLVDIIYKKHKVIWIKPEQSFVHIKFVLLKESMFGILPDKEHDEHLIIYNPTFKLNQWNYIDFNIRKKTKLLEPDLYSLEATVNGLTKFQQPTRLWWALIVIKSSKIYVSGGSEISLNCLPLTTTASPTLTTFTQTTPIKATFATTTIIANTSKTTSHTMKNVTNYFINPYHATTITPTIMGPLVAPQNSTLTSKNTFATNFSTAHTNGMDSDINSIIIGNEKYNLQNVEHRPTLELRQTNTANREISETEENSSYLVIGFNITLVLLCICLLFILIFIIKFYRGKLKKLGGNDLSNIESIDPKNMINHYEEVSKHGNKDKNYSFYEELKVKQDAIKNIQWNIVKDLVNSKTDQKKEDLCYDRPKAVKAETEETIYEELPDDLKP